MLQRFKTLSAGRKLLLGLSLLHLLIIFSTAPYILGSEVDAYALTFPSATWLRHMFIAAGICMTTIILLWLYNHYIPNIFCRYPLLIRVAIVFLIGYYIMFLYWSYPYGYHIDGDYTALADMSSHGYPLFWQGYLTGIVYLSYFLVLCHPASVFIMQTVMFAILCGYILSICFKYVRRAGSLAVLMFLFLFLCTYDNRLTALFIIPHRISFWSVPFLYVLCTLAYKLLQKDHSFLDRRMYLTFSAIIGMLAYWRTESILLLPLLPICSILFLRSDHSPIRPYLKRLLTGVITSAAVLILLSVPERIVSTPVYQNDYMLINYCGCMQGMLRDPDFDISYEGGREDLETFYSFIPESMLPNYGSGSYHYSAELNTGNCTISGWSDAERKAYEDAVHRIVMHNPLPFLRSRITTFLRTNSYIIEHPLPAEDFYEKYLVGYGSYHSRILNRYAEDGFSPVYIREMLADYGNRFQHMELSVRLIVSTAAGLLVLSYVIWAFSFCIQSFFRSHIFAGMTACGMGYKELADTVICAIVFFYGAVCYLCRFFIEALQSDLIACLMPFAEFLWYAMLLCFILFGLKRKQYAMIVIYPMLVLCMIPVILFAPIDHYIYYDGLICALYFTGAIHLLHLSQGTADAVRNDYQNYLGRRKKRK